MATTRSKLALNFKNSSYVRHVLSKRPGDKGFSLIELVIVVAVLAILAAIAVPAFNNVAENGRQAAAQTALAGIYKECEVSRLSTGTAAHTQLSTSGGVTYSGGATSTACTAVATASTAGGTSYSIDLATGTKTGW